jgi:hypothetical protein
MRPTSLLLFCLLVKIPFNLNIQFHLNTKTYPVSINTSTRLAKMPNPRLKCNTNYYYQTTFLALMPTYLLDLNDQIFMHLISVYVLSTFIANHLKTYCLNKKTLITSINSSTVSKILQSSYQSARRASAPIHC